MVLGKKSLNKLSKGLMPQNNNKKSQNIRNDIPQHKNQTKINFSKEEQEVNEVHVQLGSKGI
jgi:hypothetical protein